MAWDIVWDGLGVEKMSFGVVEESFKKRVGNVIWVFRGLNEGFLGRDRGETIEADAPDLPTWILGQFCCNFEPKTRFLVFSVFLIFLLLHAFLQIRTRESIQD